MAYEDYENEEESEDEEEKDESSESSENANAGNNTQAPVNTPAPTNNQPIDTAIKAGQEAQQPTAPAQQPATPAQTSTLPNDSPYGNAGQSSDNANNNTNDVVAKMKGAGLDDETISALQQINQYAQNLSPEEFQKGLANITAQNKNIANLYSQYYGQGSSTSGQQTPATPGTQALTSSYYNSINIDPNKTYGQVNSNPGYVYSYDAKQLQNQVNRAIFDYNKKIANGTIEGKTAADYIQPLKVDGMYGSKTKAAIDALQKAGYNVTNLPASVGGDSNSGSSGTSQSGSSTSPDDNAAQNPIGQTAQAVHTPSAPSGDSAYWDANRDATARDRQLAAIDAKGRSMDTYYGNLLEAMRNQESYQNREDNTGTEWNQPGTGFGTGNFAGVNVRASDGGDEAAVSELEAAYQANNGGHLMETPSAPTGNGAYADANRPETHRANPIDPNFSDENMYYDAYLRGITPESAYKQMMKNGNSDPETISRLVTEYADYLDEKGLYPGMPRRGEGTNESPTTDSNTVTTQREPINYNAMLDELNQMDRNDWYQRPEPQQASDAEVGSRGLGGRPAGIERSTTEPEPERQSMAGNSMSAALENYRPDEQARQRYQDNYDFLYSPNGQIKDGVTLGRGKTYWNNAEPTRDDQYYESLYRSGETPASLYHRHEGNDNAYKYSQEYENWLADRGLTDYGYGVAESWFHGGPMNISENSPGARSGAYADANRPEVHYGDTRSTTLEEADQLALYDELENIYRNSVADPHAQDYTDEVDNSISNPDTIASDDIQASSASTPRESQVGDSMSRSLADNQAQPTTNIFAQDAPPVITPERENQYKTLFNNEISALHQMYPDASYSQLYDYLNLFYQQNGDTNTEYYKWFNSFL